MAKNQDLDKMINGEGENFWEDDDKKTFTLAHHFTLRRLIIARLSGRKDYEDFLDKYFKFEENKYKIKNWGEYDRNNLTLFSPKIINLLKDVKPIF